MIALGLLLLVAAAIVTLVGVLTNSGGAHALNSDFSLFGYHFHGSAGQLLLIGVIVGAVGMLGLNMLLAGIGRGVHPPSSTRRELKHSRHQAGALHEERDTLARQLEQERIARARVEAERAEGARHPNLAYPIDPSPAGQQVRAVGGHPQP